MEDRIKSVFSAVFGISQDEINNNSGPDTIESWDSLKHMNLVVSLEEEFNVEFNDSEILELISFANVKEILSKKN